MSTRRFGLTVDNLLSADVLLADGTFVTASGSSHPDLFWALRGGGGNFGVVTSFTFRCHDIGQDGTIIGGPVLNDFADMAKVMRWYRELLPSLPETAPRPRRRDHLRLPRRRLGRGHRRRRPRPRPRRPHHPLGPQLLARTAPHLGRRRLRQLPDERRPGPDQNLLTRQLRPAHLDQTPLRPRQHLAHQTEHPARQRAQPE